jgi:tRNA (guanosine-2'-O-)-methyltransferase
MNNDLIQHLSSFVTEHRIQLFKKILDLRTRYITVVLEDIYQAHNASAVLRSCECFGVQDVHIIENHNEYRISPDVALGAHKWLSLHRYNQPKDNTSAAILSLKNQGYRIIATSPHKNDYNLDELDIRKGKFALLFGAELPGLSTTALEMADEFVKIPMVGFTESLNISVTAALCLHHLTRIIRNDNSIVWPLSPAEKEAILLTWLKNTIKRSELIEKAFLSKHKGSENQA